MTVPPFPLDPGLPAAYDRDGIVCVRGALDPAWVERMRGAVAASPLWHPDGDVAITVSVGVAMAEQSPTPEAVLSRADLALYRAKAWGRARVVVHEPEGAPVAAPVAARCSIFVPQPARPIIPMLAAAGSLITRPEILSRALMTGGAEPYRWPHLVADIVLVGASMLQKVVLSHIVSAASQYQEFSGQTHFFESMDDALLWLEVPASLLATPAAV